ncbi:MAG TPA: hypothetical protein PK037_11285, partial [Saprospiraceae bacterium]|nr:hypothetical protein [Saprospiraceae bacterium]
YSTCKNHCSETNITKNTKFDEELFTFTEIESREETPTATDPGCLIDVLSIDYGICTSSGLCPE